jgi:hypothetical protein
MLRPTTQHHGYGSRTDQLPEVHPQCPGTLSRVLKALQQLSVMTHNKIKTCADFTSARVALQNQLCALQQKRGLGRMFLGSQLLQPPIEVFRDTEIHSHAFMVPNRYPPLAGLHVSLIGPDSPEQGRGVLESSVVIQDATLPNPEVCLLPASL